MVTHATVRRPALSQMDARLPLTAATVCLLVLTAFWITSAPSALPDEVQHTTRAELQRLTRQGGFGSERVNPMAEAMALLRPQQADSFAWADAPGQGRPLRPHLPTPWCAHCKGVHACGTICRLSGATTSTRSSPCQSTHDHKWLASSGSASTACGSLKPSGTMVQHDGAWLYQAVP